MPVRLVIVLLLIVFEAFFIGFNLENTCNVWLFKVFEAVPVYITVLFSFAAGVLVSLLLLAFRKIGRSRRSRRERDTLSSRSGRGRKGKANALQGYAMRTPSASSANSSNKPEGGSANNPKI